VLEQERQVLASGLQAVERAQEWFNSQMTSVQERIRSLGKSTANQNVFIQNRAYKLQN
jgi:hypothetical protein